MLKALSVAPIAARMMAGEAAMKIAGIGSGALAPGLLATTPSLNNGPSNPLRFFDFGSWFKDIGRDQVREEASYVAALDPDLACMQSMSLSAKVRMQRERQYSRYMEARKRWFTKSISAKGLVEWWP